MVQVFQKSIIDKYHVRFNIDFQIWEDSSFIYEYIKYVNKFSVTKSAEYFYNKPNFTEKYDRLNKFECCITILGNINGILHNSEKL